MSQTSVKAPSQGPLVVSGGARLSREMEIALNTMLRHAAGEMFGMPLYKISWAMEDNHAQLEPSGSYKFDPSRVPICVEPNQASYHLLSWAPPTETDLSLAHNFPGEDMSKGSYTCILHFIDPKTGAPFNPTAAILENIIPVLSEFNEIAKATWKGMLAERNRLRSQKIAHWKDQEKQAEARYEKFAENLLEDSRPVFEGQPFTTMSGKKTKTFAETLPGERDRAREKQAEINSSEVREVGFSFSSRTPKSLKK